MQNDGAEQNRPVSPGLPAERAGQATIIDLLRRRKGRLLLIIAVVALAALCYYAIRHDGDFPGAEAIRNGADTATGLARVLFAHRDTRDERAKFPNPAYRHYILKELLLDLTNAQRAAAGVPPVRMGGNAAAQLHAEASLEGCYASHWDRWGLKPQHRYTLAGGTGAGAENVHATGYCAGLLEGHLPILSMADEVSEVVADWMASPEHRRVLLDPAHTLLNVGIAHDRFNASIVQHFTSDYVRYERKPDIDSDGTLRLSGLAAGASLDLGAALNFQIAYDPPPKYLTAGQLTHTYGLCNPAAVAYLTEPLRTLAPSAAGSPAAEPATRHCVDPYRIPADVAPPDSPSAAARAQVAALVAGAGIPVPANAETLRIVADRLDVEESRFDVAADLAPLLRQKGPGIYTVRVWGRPRHVTGPVILSEQSIFWLTAPPQGAPY